VAQALMRRHNSKTEQAGSG